MPKSKQMIEKTVCPKCGRESNSAVWDYINVTTDPDLRAVLLDGSLFQWRCPHCGHQCRAGYALIYHDEARGFLLCYDAECEKRELPLNDELLALPGREVMRIVRSFPQLAEKIRILTDGMDDRAVEVIKQILLASLNSAAVDRLIYAAHYEGQLAFEALREGITLGLLPVEESLYRTVLVDVQNVSMPEDAFAAIDATWAEAFLPEQH